MPRLEIQNVWLDIETIITLRYCSKINHLYKADLQDNLDLSNCRIIIQIEGVNFINIVRTHFLDESALCSFSLVTAFFWL